MSSGNRGGREGRGRMATGRRRRPLVEPWVKDARQMITELMAEGYTANDIIRYLLSGELGPPSRPEEAGGPNQPSPEVLKVTEVDLHVQCNTKAHHTDEYDIAETCEPVLVVRRGQPFEMEVHFSRTFPRENHDLRLVFQIGDSPTESKDTRKAFLVSDKAKEGKWGAAVVKRAGQSMEVSVRSPAQCIVGKWRLSLEVVKKGEGKPVSCHTLEKPIYILFNPWCQEDAVFCDNEEHLEEYVLDDVGCIFVGNSWFSYSRPWEFGQFSGNVLDCSLSLLDSAGLSVPKRADPVKVVRTLSAKVNAFDEGVLVGNWSGEYGDDTSPSEWTGSAAILEQFYDTKCPVKYGQCWVFSGVLTTVCRALGIPCRSVTNFDSAHDTDASVTIDMHVDINMDPMNLHSDSVWNFHVWNEAWMRRDDLPEGYGGWQACDATPQERSDGVFQCGPCPLRAIRQGDLTLPFDAPFIFAEVNADKVFWQWDVDAAEFRPVQYDKKVVGRNMSTRALKKQRDGGGYESDREVVTGLYKFPEGSDEERAAVLKAYRVMNPGCTAAYTVGPQDVEFKLDFCVDTPVGQAFSVKLICQNKSKEERTVQGQGSISTMYYTGIVAEELTRAKYTDIRLKPGATEMVQVTVTPDMYTLKAKDGFFLAFTIVAMVKETKQSAIKSSTAMLAKPGLSVKAPSDVQARNPFEVTLTFSNPLDCTLTKCKVKVEGPGIALFQEDLVLSDVPGHGTFMTKLKLKARKTGQRHIVFAFSSKQMDNITATHYLKVQQQE